MKNAINEPGVLSEEGGAETKGSRMSEPEKLEPKKKETAVEPEKPMKRPIRVEITLVPTYKPSKNSAPDM